MFRQGGVGRIHERRRGEVLAEVGHLLGGRAVVRPAGPALRIGDRLRQLVAHGVFELRDIARFRLIAIRDNDVVERNGLPAEAHVDEIVIPGVPLGAAGARCEAILGDRDRSGEIEHVEERTGRVRKKEGRRRGTGQILAQKLVLELRLDRAVCQDALRRLDHWLNRIDVGVVSARTRSAQGHAQLRVLRLSAQPPEIVRVEERLEKRFDGRIDRAVDGPPRHRNDVQILVRPAVGQQGTAAVGEPRRGSLAVRRRGLLDRRIEKHAPLLAHFCILCILRSESRGRFGFRCLHASSPTPAGDRGPGSLIAWIRAGAG